MAGAVTSGEPQPTTQPLAPFLAANAALLLSKVGFAVMQLIGQAMETFGLRPGHFAILNVIEAEEGRSQQSLAQGLHIDPSTMVALIDDLEECGLAVRRRNPEDRRAYGLHLTAKGRKLLTRARSAADDVHDLILEPLDERDRERLRELLVQLATAGHLPKFSPPSGVCPPGMGGPRT